MFTTKEILEKSMEKAKKVERLTRATKFSNVFKSMVEGANPNDLIKKSPEPLREPEHMQAEIDDSYEYIVEDPNEITVDISYEKHSDSDVPFFKVLQSRLGEIYG